MSHDQLYLSTRPSFFNDVLDAEFMQNAVVAYPNEICAYVKDGQLHFCENISSTPKETFELSAEDSLAVSNSDGFIHSHPDGNLFPSKEDMSAQIAAGIPFGIVTCTHDSCSNTVWWGDHLLSTPLEGRPFVHGIYDCYSLIRAEQFQRTGIVLPDYARANNWWEVAVDNEDLYETYFSDAKYKPLSTLDSMEVGDGIFMKINTKVISHAAVYIGNGLILHHLRGRLSRVEHVAQWAKYIDKRVRYSSD